MLENFEQNIPLMSCACFLVSPLHGPFKRRFKEMGEADGRNFSCLLHGFPSKLGRASSVLPKLAGTHKISNQNFHFHIIFD